MKGFYKMRLLACVLPLALGLSACGSSSSSAANNAIAPPDSSVTPVSYVLFSIFNDINRSCVVGASNNVEETGFGDFSAGVRAVYPHGTCSNWRNLTDNNDQDPALNNLVDITADLYGNSGHEFDISQYVENSESIVSASFTINLSVECSGQNCDAGSSHNSYNSQAKQAAVAAGIPLTISLVANRGQGSSEESVIIRTIDPLATDNSPVAGQQYVTQLNNEALRFLEDHQVFSLRFVGKSFAIYCGDRGSSQP